MTRIISRLHPATIWDIGANIGFWSLFLTTLVPRCNIRCYEPDPLNQKYLFLNRDRNAIGSWTVRPVALSDRKGTSSFVTDVTTGSTGRIGRGKTYGGDTFKFEPKEIVVEVSTVDDEIQAGATPPEFIKCDVEGHECAVLQGGRKMLMAYHPVILFEDTGVAETATLLRDLGYEFFDIQGRRLETPQWNTLAVHKTQAAELLSTQDPSCSGKTG